MDVYTCTDEELATIQKRHNATQETIERDVKILNDWVKTQPHFPEKLQVDNFCLKPLMHSKYDVETVKQRIEAYFTIKAKHVDLYDVFKDDRRFVLPSQMLGLFVPLPKLGPNLERIYAGKVNAERRDPETFSLDQFIQTLIFSTENGFLFELVDRLTPVLDCEGFTVDHVKKIDFVKVFRMTDLIKNGYSAKLRRLHLLNVGTAVRHVINASLAVLGRAFQKKIHIHENMESLHKHLSPDYLPTEFGGTNGSIAIIIKRMDEILMDKRNHFIETVKYVADETKRTGPTTSTFGVDIFF